MATVPDKSGNSVIGIVDHIETPTEQVLEAGLSPEQKTKLLNNSDATVNLLEEIEANTSPA
jgi:hypothetical protein